MNVPVPEPVPAPEPPRSGWFRENVEAVVVAIVLALLIRQYGVEAFVIPTGSLAPTLLGAHLDLECTNCGKPQAVSDQHYTISRQAARQLGGNATGKCPRCGKSHVATIRDDQWVNGAAEIRCDQCGAGVPMHPVLAPRGSGDRLLGAVCSNCEIEFENRVASGLWPRGAVSRGDRILVDKFAYRFEPPRRYEIVVFKFPDNPEQNYIKRLIGLPGETIDVREGDIYVEGRIARKPEAIQESLWRPVHEARWVERDPTAGDRPRPWRDEGGTWAQVEGGRSWRGEAAGTGTGTSTTEGGGKGWLVYNRGIRDFNSYNESKGRNTGGDNVLGDVRVRFRVVPERGGVKALARIRVNDEAVACEIDCTSGTTSMRLSGQEIAARPAAAAPAGTPRERMVALSRVDRTLLLEVDGAQAARFELDDEAPSAKVRSSEVAIGVSGGPAVFRDLEVDRDVHYLTSIPFSHVDFPFRVPDGHYFFLGDNSSNSTDSRVWKTVPAGHLVGRAFMVFWPAVPGDFAIRRIR